MKIKAKDSDETDEILQSPHLLPVASTAVHNNDTITQKGLSKRKSTFELAQNAQIHITLQMRKVSSRPLLFIQYQIRPLAYSKGIYQTVRMLFLCNGLFYKANIMTDASVRKYH